MDEKDKIALDGCVIYVSGPASTTDAEYADARTWLRQHGARHVTMPNRLVDGSLDRDQRLRERIHDLTKRTFDADRVELIRRPWYDMVVLLDGWGASWESDIECRIALACDIPVVEMADLRAERSQNGRDDD